jgi:hypothetical protein
MRSFKNTRSRRVPRARGVLGDVRRARRQKRLVERSRKSCASREAVDTRYDRTSERVAAPLLVGLHDVRDVAAEPACCLPG